MSTPKDVAKFMFDQIQKDKILYQREVVGQIEEVFGKDFVYLNDNGNMAVDRKVLAAFRKLCDGSVVWVRGRSYWELKE